MNTKIPKMNIFNSLSIKAKVVYFSAAIILLAFAGMSLSNYFTSQTGAVKRITEEELPVYIDNIYNTIQTHLWKEIMVSDVISNNFYLMEWLKENEDSVESLNSFLKLINNRYKLFVTITSDATLNYYSNEGFERTMSEDTDPWYFAFKNSSNPREFNVDPDYDTKEVRLWVNNKILDSNNEFIGVASVGLDLTETINLVLSNQYGERGNIMMVDENGSVKIHKNQDLIDIKNSHEKGKTIQTIDGISSVASELLNNPNNSYTYKDSKGEEYIVVTRFIPEFKWYLIVEVSKSEVIEQPRALFLKNILFGIIITIIIIFVSIMGVNRVLINPINNIVGIIKNISTGRFDTKIETSRKDEMGQILVALQQMQQNTSSIVMDIQKSANSIMAAGNQINSSSQQLSQGASEQASSIEEVSASMEEMVSNIHQNSDNAKETADISSQAATKVSTVGSSSEQSLNTVAVIADKINIINDIAFQTNLLALNAAVEAARAGELGKGFAVVASEVRKLAERSKVAADEINQLSNQSVDVTKKAKELMEQTFPEIERTSDLVQKIVASSVEQISGAEQVNSAILQLNNVAQQNAATAEQLAGSAELFKQQAEKLENSISYFKF